MTVAGGLLDRARSAPGTLALVTGAERCTYGELAEATRASATALAAAGGGGRVALLAPPGRGFVAAFLGAGLAGAAAAVLHTGWSDREAAEALALVRPDLVVSTRALAPVVLRAGAARQSCRLLPLPGHGPRDGTGAPGQGHPRVDIEAPFYVGFTSGTTGRPRAYTRSHRSWLRSIEVAGPLFGGEGEHLVAPGALDHSLFLYAAVHGLATGATVHLQERFTARAVLRTLAEAPRSRLVVVPAMLAALLAAAGDRRFPGVRAVLCSGATLPAALVARARETFCDAEVVDFYGASELSFVAARRARASDAPGLVGRPFPGVEVRVRDDAGRPCPDGVEGRLWVRSDLLFSSYLDAGDPGAARRDPGGWVTVGDRARREADGRLYVSGRDGTMLNCGGLNVSPEEVERVLLECPDVVEVAVVGWDDPVRGQVPCAVVRLRAGCEGAVRQRLAAHCRARLARGKRPRRWLQVTDFPRTPSSKVARAALTAGLRDGTLRPEELP